MKEEHAEHKDSVEYIHISACKTRSIIVQTSYEDTTVKETDSWTALLDELKNERKTKLNFSFSWSHAVFNSRKFPGGIFPARDRHIY